MKIVGYVLAWLGGALFGLVFAMSPFWPLFLKWIVGLLAR